MPDLILTSRVQVVQHVPSMLPLTRLGVLGLKLALVSWSLTQDAVVRQALIVVLCAVRLHPMVALISLLVRDLVKKLSCRVIGLLTEDVVIDLQFWRKFRHIRIFKETVVI